jgi:hypothetical protein
MDHVFIFVLENRKWNHLSVGSHDNKKQTDNNVSLQRLPTFSTRPSTTPGPTHNPRRPPTTTQLTQTPKNDAATARHQPQQENERRPHQRNATTTVTTHGHCQHSSMVVLAQVSQHNPVFPFFSLNMNPGATSLSAMWQQCFTQYDSPSQSRPTYHMTHPIPSTRTPSPQHAPHPLNAPTPSLSASATTTPPVPPGATSLSATWQQTTNDGFVRRLLTPFTLTLPVTANLPHRSMPAKCPNDDGASFGPQVIILYLNLFFPPCEHLLAG